MILLKLRQDVSTIVEEKSLGLRLVGLLYIHVSMIHDMTSEELIH
jgi:hypothetical protein